MRQTLGYDVVVFREKVKHQQIFREACPERSRRKPDHRQRHQQLLPRHNQILSVWKYVRHLHYFISADLLRVFRFLSSGEEEDNQGDNYNPSYNPSAQWPIETLALWYLCRCRCGCGCWCQRWCRRRCRCWCCCRYRRCIDGECAG